MRPQRLLLGLVSLLGAVIACKPVLLASHGHGLTKQCSLGPDGTAILCDGHEFAAIECYSDAGKGPAGPTCRALAVRYADGDVAWLYKASRFDPEHPLLYRPTSNIDVDRAYEPIVAIDGETIWFRSRSIFSRGGVRKYDVQSGQLTNVDRADEWRVWAAVHEGNAIRLGQAASSGRVRLP